MEYLYFGRVKCNRTPGSAVTFNFLGPSPLETQIQQVLETLDRGVLPGQVETAQVDIKEERGRRDDRGNILPGGTQNEEAGKHLAGEMACFANTPGGGAIILGVSDRGEFIGTELDHDWLRLRIYELTDRRLTVTVRETRLRGTRILVLITQEAIEPIRFDNRLKWRVRDNCVEIDATTWHTGRLSRIGVDWSAQPSGHNLEQVQAVALETARRYLGERGAAGDDAARELAAASDEDLLRRLNLVGGDGRLTNAGSLLFVETPDIGLDYRRRDYPGADSTVRVRRKQSLLQQIWETELAFQAANRLTHVPDGFAHRQVRAIPQRAFREALINGVVHRDWLSPQVTEVEHVGDTVTITSPGGFVGGVGPDNIITHPAVPRYRSLAEAVAALRLSEREGIGVDRMVSDMLALGHSEPEIVEVPGPFVRVSLVGGEADAGIVAFFAAMEPRGSNIEALLIIQHLRQCGWIDAVHAAPVLQRSLGEARSTLDRAATIRVDARSIIEPLRGTRPDEPPAYRLGDIARERLKGRVPSLETPSGREQAVLTWARTRGRVASTLAADLTGMSVTAASALLGRLEEDGLLRPGRENRRGRGFFYVPTGTSEESRD
jgi:ATP-dependent DNA helicase RecG